MSVVISWESYGTKRNKKNTTNLIFILRRGYEFKYILTVLFYYTHRVRTSENYGFKQFEEKISG